jgi:branched-chain amino acid transport system substrate-binding protein
MEKRMDNDVRHKDHERRGRMVMRKRALTLWTGVGVALTVAVAAGCSSGAGTSGGGSSGGSGEYVVGSSLGLTGSLADIASGYSAGISSYFDYVNSHGGINGHKVKYMSLDDTGDVTTAVGNVRQLVTGDDVSALFFTLSDVQAATNSYTVQNKVVTISQGVDASLLNPPQPYLFAGDVVEPDEATPMMAFAKTKLTGIAHPRIAVITTQTTALQELDTRLQGDAKAAGMQVVGNQVVPLTSTDESTQAAQFAAAKPDLVFSGLITSQEPSMFKTLRQHGYTGPIIQYDGGSSYALMKQLADPNDYFLFAYSFGHNSGAQVTIMNQAAKLANSSPETYFFSNGYVQAYVSGQALMKCGYPCAGTKLAAALQSLGSLQTGGLTFGPWTYTATDHAGPADVGFFSWDPSALDSVQDGGGFSMPTS